MQRLALSLVCLFIFTSCSFHQRNSHRVVSVTPSHHPETNQKHFDYSQQAYGGAYFLDPELSAYMNQLLKKAILSSPYPDRNCEIAIVNSSIPNVWSFPEGHIAITRGLLVDIQNEAELMAILCHELAHLSAKDGQANIQKVILNAGPVKLDVYSNPSSHDFSVGPLGSGSGLLTLKYDVQCEVNADQSSMLQLTQMGYSPQSILDFQRRIHVYQKSQDTNWSGGYLAKHPLTEYQLSKTEYWQTLYPQSGYFENHRFEAHVKQLKSTMASYDLLDEGYRALLNRKYDQAIEMAEKGFTQMPEESHFLLLKAKAQQRLGHFVSSLKTLNQAIALNPYYFDHYLQRGLVKEQLDDWAEASHDLERSLALLPTAEAYYALGEIDYNKERQAEAIEYFRKASISQSPGGKRAIKRLKNLGLPLSGIQTLEVRPSFTSTGHLNLEVENQGNKVAKSIVIDVEQKDALGRTLYRHLVELKKELEPNTSICQQTNIGPFFSESQMKQSIHAFAVYCEE